MGFNAGGKVAIVGVGRTKITRKGDRAIGALAVEASLKAIEDAQRTANTARVQVAVLAAPDVARVDLAGQPIAPRASAPWT